MKRILFLLLLTVSVYGQNPSRFAKIQITGNANSGTATKVNVQEANGEVNTQAINTAFNKNFGLNTGDVVGADNLLNQYSTVPSNWVAQTYTLGSVVFYAGKQWYANTATVAGDVPNVSSKWTDITFDALNNNLSGKANLSGGNSFTGNQQITGNISATGLATISGNVVGGGFIKTGAPATNLLVADGSDIPQSTFALASSAHNPVTIGTSNGLSLSTQVLSLGLASSGVTGALSGTDWNTFNNKQKLIFVTPEDFGAIGDGIADDRASIQNAINSGRPVFLNAKTYLVNGTLNILSSTYITGSGEKSILKTNSNSPVISVQSDKNYFKNFKILGNGRGTLVNYTTTRPLQNGIEVNGAYYNNIIEDVIFDNLGNSGIYGINNQNGVSTNVTSSINIKSCFFFNSLYGINFDTLFEYNLVYNSIFKDNETGIVIKGGNNPIIGGHILNNRTGVSVLSGSNDSHSTLSSVTINHSIEKAIYIGDIINGFTIDNCIIFFNGIELIGSKDVIVNGGLFKLNNPLVITNTNGTVVQNVKFVSTSVSTSFSGNTGLRFFNNSYTDGTARPAAMVDNITNITNTDIFDINASISSKNLLRMRVNSGNRYLIGSDSGITGGNDGDLNTYVYGNNSMFFSTNGVKRFTISGSGVASFSSPVIIPNGVNSNEGVNKGQLDAVATSGNSNPTITNIANVASTSNSTLRYQKVGNVVTIGYECTISATASNTITTIQIPLPFSTSSNNRFGSGVAVDTANNNNVMVWGSANASVAQITYKPTITGSLNLSITFTYTTN